MSGNVQGIGFQLDKVTFCNKARGGCGAEIRWGTMFGKRHPFNLDGSSHFDTCPEADGFRKGNGPSLKTLGDRDTFYRQRWRTTYSGYGGRGSVASDRDFDVGLCSRVECPPSVVREITEALCSVGGPYACWSPGELREREFFTGAGVYEEGGAIECVFVRVVFFRELAFRVLYFKVESRFHSVADYRLVPDSAEFRAASGHHLEV